MISLDISVSKGEHIQESMRIIHEEKKMPGARPDIAPQLLPSTPPLVALTCYTTQTLYAPLHTVEPLPDVQPEGMRLTKTITTLLPALPASTMPIGSWKLGPYRLAAVRLQNKSTARLELDSRQLQGWSYAASFQHR